MCKDEFTFIVSRPANDSHKQAYTAFDHAASSLSLAFYTEAKNFWQLESDSDSFLNVAALQILGHGGSTNGLDGEGQLFVQLCREMAERLGLQDEALRTPNRYPQSGTIDDGLRFRSHIAWGHFSARTLVVRVPIYQFIVMLMKIEHTRSTIGKCLRSLHFRFRFRDRQAFLYHHMQVASRIRVFDTL